MTSTRKVLKVLSFNLWYGGSKRNVSVADLTAFVRDVEADLIGTQEWLRWMNRETRRRANTAQELAEALGFHYVEASGIISRYPIRSVLRDTRGDVIGAVVLVDGVVVHFYNVHLAYHPYGPYQLTGKSYYNAQNDNHNLYDVTATSVSPELKQEHVDNVVHEAFACRMPIINDIINSIGIDNISIICGDFNEPSHLDDWGADATSPVGVRVEWPISKYLQSQGFCDNYHHLHLSDLKQQEQPQPQPQQQQQHQYRHPVQKTRVITWSIAEEDAGDVFDRIDFIYTCSSFEVIRCDLLSRPEMSDHKAVLSTLLINRSKI
jgi:endonuclease/exonuclease/phosphatase family metal-dependent hydrolase